MTSLLKSKLWTNGLGRCALASLFILGGLNKIFNYDLTLTSMIEVGLTPAALLLPVVILLELGAGLLIAFKIKGFQKSALLLAIFTIATNYFFHDFWTMEGAIRQLELSLFFKNIAIAGALLFVATANYEPDSSMRP